MRSHFVVTRMARLTQLRVHASNAAKDRGIVPPGLRFRETTHHVTEMFVSLLGRRYSLNGSSLVQITCGPSGSDPEFYNVLGSTGVFVESFDFGAYRTMSDAEREETVLALVVDQLLRNRRAGKSRSGTHTHLRRRNAASRLRAGAGIHEAWSLVAAPTRTSSRLPTTGRFLL